MTGVVMLVNEFPPLPVGGAETQAERLSACLAQRGWKVWVVTRHADGLPFAETRDGFEILRPKTLGGGKMRTLTFIVFSLLQLYRMRSEYQILHAHLAFGPAFAAALLGRLLGKRVVVKLGGSNAIGIFYPFIEDEGVRLIGVEAAGHGLNTDAHSASLVAGEYGVLHGSASLVLQTDDGQIRLTHSVSAGLDYPGVGPEHCALKDSGRARYETISDCEAVEAFRVLAQTEGIIPALESAHAIALALKLKAEFRAEDLLVINVSGRGDKDCAEVQEYLDRLPRAW